MRFFIFKFLVEPSAFESCRVTADSPVWADNNSFNSSISVLVKWEGMMRVRSLIVASSEFLVPSVKLDFAELSLGTRY